MAASYEATLDCPALCGVRRTEDILAGHMAAGQFKPDLWTLLECDGQPAGVLLLNPVPDAQCLELVYIGLSVAARGRGLGRRLMEHALWQAAEQPQPVIAVAVDRANVPATRLYRDFSFYRVATRVAMICRCPSVDPA
jgi:ribosomal protein S18 acetylase RimI-like enzyme